MKDGDHAGGERNVATPLYLKQPVTDMERNHKMTEK